MDENDEPTQVWSDGMPEAPAPLAAAPQPAPPLPPASRPGPPIWLIGGAAIVLVIVIGVGGIFIGRLMGSPKVTTAPTAAATAPAQSDSAPLAAASAAAPPAQDPSAVALTAGQQTQCDSLAGQNVTFTATIQRAGMDVANPSTGDATYVLSDPQPCVGAEVTIYDPGGKLLCQAGQSITATGVIQQITNDQGDPTGETRIVTSNYSCK